MVQSKQKEMNPSNYNTISIVDLQLSNRFKNI